MKRRPFYLAAPGDVVALHAEAESILDVVLPCSMPELIGAARGRGDLSVMLLHRACYRGSNGAFLERVEKLPITVTPLQRSTLLLIAPGLNSREHPEMGADGCLVTQIARRFGARTEVFDIHPSGSPSANGEKIAQRLERLKGEKAWIISISKGTADVRAAYSLIGHWPRGVSGWINLSGVFQGTPVADRITNSAWQRWLGRILLALGGIDFDGIEEMRTDCSLWRLPVEPPISERMVHVLGFPPPWAVEMRISHHYLRLSEKFGPNDGLTPLAHCFNYPGRVFPVWGADHFMRVPEVPALLYRLLNFVAAIESDVFVTDAA